MPLIVVHGYDHVVSSADRLGKDRIRRHGTKGMDAQSVGILDGRDNLVQFLAAKKPVFPGMGIQPRNADHRVFDTHLL